jgi:leader peptidase (prepilin peptidase)/N-methyltransferase
MLAAPVVATAAPLAALPSALPTWAFWALMTWLGLCVGSFLNVVVHRLPQMMQRQEHLWAREALELPAEPPAPAFNLMVPRSTCPGCGHMIGALENIPVLSWLVLRGRCAHCRNPISPRYPLVELATAALTVLIAWLLGPGWPLAWALLFTWSLIAAALIDLDHQLLPDAIVLPLLWLGLLVNVDGTFVPLPDAVIGAAVGYGTLWSIYWAFKLLTGREGMGYGDFKLMGAMGAWFGWMLLPNIVLLAALSGIVAAVALRILGRLDGGAPMPFGPFIAAAGFLALVLQASGRSFLP